MLAIIVVSGLAIGAVYATVGFAYNIMYSTSKVMSFTSGQLAMIGSVVGAFLAHAYGLPVILALFAALAAGALMGAVTEVLAVAPVAKYIERHLYVLSTLAFALMVQQVVAIGWGTQPRPFPTLLGLGAGLTNEKYWLPIAACIVALVGLELLYRRTMIGRAFLAIAEDADAARSLGIPVRRTRIVSYMIAGAVGALAGFAGGELLLAFFANGMNLTIYGFVPIAMGGIGSNKGAVIGGAALGIIQQAANYLLGGNFVSIASFAVFIVVLMLVPGGLFGEKGARRV